MIPMFVSMQTMRRGVATSAAAMAKRGSIASRNGSANVMPVPRRNVRRLIGASGIGTCIGLSGIWRQLLETVSVTNREIKRQKLLLARDPGSDLFHPARGMFTQARSAEVDTFAAAVAELALDRIAVRTFERDAILPQ